MTSSGLSILNGSVFSRLVFGFLVTVFFFRCSVKGLGLQIGNGSRIDMCNSILVSISILTCIGILDSIDVGKS